MTPDEAITNLKQHALDRAAPSDLREAVRVVELIADENTKLREVLAQTRGHISDGHVDALVAAAIAGPDISKRADYSDLISELEKAHNIYGNTRYLSALHKKVIAALTAG